MMIEVDGVHSHLLEMNEKKNHIHQDETKSREEYNKFEHANVIGIFNSRNLELFLSQTTNQMKQISRCY